MVNTLALKSKEIVESRKAALSASGENFDEGKDILSTLCKMCFAEVNEVANLCL